MKFTVPYVIHDKPTLDEYRALYSCPKMARYAFTTAKKVWIRTVVSGEQNHRCCWCGCQTVVESGKKNSATLEHIVPKSQGGTYEYDNMAMSCSDCNNARGTADVEQFMARTLLRVNYNVKAHKKSKPSKIYRALESQKVRELVKSGITENPYDEGTRQWTTFNRYTASPKLTMFSY